MPTIAELEQQLTDAANNSDMGAISSIVSSLTTAEKAAFDPTVFDLALSAVTNYTFSDPSLAASTAGTFMQEVGLYTDAFAVSQGYFTFAQFANFAGVTAMVDNTDPQIYPHLDPFVLGQTLFGFGFGLFFDPAGAVAAATDFLSHLSLYTDPYALTSLMQSFAQFGSLDGVNAVVNNIDPQAYANLDPFQVGLALATIPNTTFSDPAGTLATTANFLQHLSLYTDPTFITGTMQTFLMFGLTNGVSTIVDNIDPQIYPHLDPFALGQALFGLSANIFADPATAVAETADFLSHLSLYTDPQAISDDLMNFAQFDILDGINAIVNNLDPQVYPHLDSRELGIALMDISGNAFNDPAGAIATVANFVSHLGLYTDPGAITGAMQQFAFGNLEGVMAIVDNLDPQVYPNLDSSVLGSMLVDIAFSSAFDPATAVANAADFLDHLSPYTNPDSIIFAMRAFADNGVLAGTNAIIEHTDPQVYSHFNSVNLGFALFSIANDTLSLDAHDVAGTVRLFSQTLLPYADSGYVEQAMDTFAHNGNLFALGGVLDYTTSAQWDALSTTFKTDLHNLGITTGTYGDDNFNGHVAADTYYGLGGDDRMDGIGGDDFLFGGAGDDKLIGGNGNDYLDGGIGSDLLKGGAGADTFAFNNHTGFDEISDFDKGTGGDVLDFREMLTNFETGDAITDYIHAQTVGGHTIISFDADGAGPGAAVDIVQLHGVTGLDIQALFNNGQILI